MLSSCGDQGCRGWMLVPISLGLEGRGLTCITTQAQPKMWMDSSESGLWHVQIPFFLVLEFKTSHRPCTVLKEAFMHHLRASPGCNPFAGVPLVSTTVDTGPALPILLPHSKPSQFIFPAKRDEVAFCRIEINQSIDQIIGQFRSFHCSFHSFLPFHSIHPSIPFIVHLVFHSSIPFPSILPFFFVHASTLLAAVMQLNIVWARIRT